MDSGDSKKPQTEDDDRKVMTGTVETSQNTNLKYFHGAIIQGKKLKAYIDLSSQCIMMKESCAKELGLEYSPLDKPIVIKGFGQGLAKAIGKLTTEIKIDEAVALTEILVVPDNFQEIPLLVGQPFTDQDHIVIIRRGNALRILEDNEVDKTSLSNLTIPELPHAKVSLWVKDADFIPSNFVGIGKVYTPCKIDRDLYAEKRTEFDTCIPRCIIKLNDVDETQIPILNLSNRDIAIKMYN
ncbi:hypothetical protein QE152_g3977 [Popillia japonica]|uniref:Uncharacterized protein n=1 Tax=Popillia japonica TaxID=7064 RepID=A0AAW1N269_POPJA